jgi:hypothetical protein
MWTSESQMPWHEHAPKKAMTVLAVAERWKSALVLVAMHQVRRFAEPTTEKSSARRKAMGDDSYTIRDATTSYAEE